jgi:hypothetical protein
MYSPMNRAAGTPLLSLETSSHEETKESLILEINQSDKPMGKA